MALSEHTDREIINLIQLLPVILEIGEHKLYDTGKFSEYYPDLADDYYRSLEEWKENYYYATENLMPEPKNSRFASCLKHEISDMLNWDQLPEWEDNLHETLDQSDLLKQFYDDYRKTYFGIIAYLSELNSRLKEYGATELLPVFLNLYHENCPINIDSMSTLHVNIVSSRLDSFSISSSLAKSEELRDAAYRKGFYLSKSGVTLLHWYKDCYLDDPLRHNSYYDFIYKEFEEAFMQEDIPTYNHRIVANLLPFLFYGYIGTEIIDELQNMFKPLTAGLLKRLSKVREDLVAEFIIKYDKDFEGKYVLVFLRAEFKWRLNKKEDPAKLITEFLSHFLGSELDDCIYTELLNPIRKMLDYHSG